MTWNYYTVTRKLKIAYNDSLCRSLDIQKYRSANEVSNNHLVSC